MIGCEKESKVKRKRKDQCWWKQGGAKGEEEQNGGEGREAHSELWSGY